MPNCITESEFLHCDFDVNCEAPLCNSIDTNYRWSRAGLIALDLIQDEGPTDTIVFTDNSINYLYPVVVVLVDSIT